MRLLLIGLFIFVPFATAEDSTKKATLDDLSFLTGSWRGTIGGDVVIEEVWSAPRGGSMMGMFRIIAGDKTTLYEFLAIEDSAAGPVLRFKHFSPGDGLVSREEKHEAVTLALSSLVDGVATFEGANAGKKLALVFKKSTDGLTVDLHREKGGKMVIDAFVYRRVE